MAGHGLEQGQAGPGAGASLLGKLAKREEWGGFLLCGFSSEQKEGLKFFQKLLFMSLQGFLVMWFLGSQLGN